MTKDSDTKHLKYFAAYKPNDIFWGIGIENETYLEFKKSDMVLGSFIQNSHGSERYSVDYYKTYLNNFFNKTVDKYIKSKQLYNVPVLVNGHYLTKCDANGEHSTTYTKIPKPNPKFSGKTNLQTLKDADPYFEKEEDNSYCFDGDTIEFMTLNFYKTTTHDVINELQKQKSEFLKRINAIKPDFCKGKTLQYPEKNHGFARMATNINNLAIFNNGTYHFNFTLPTKLNAEGEIADRKKFNDRHKKAIRFIQFMEPFFIAKFGSGDPLGIKLNEYYRRFPRGSQRCAASRYIGVGTYDTREDTLTCGKLLQVDRTVLESRWKPNNWYNQLYSQINYKKGEKIGYDINFNKFKNHGIEIRFFDWFPEKYLDNVMRTLVHLLDLAETCEFVMNPTINDMWNNFAYRAILEGPDATVQKDEIRYISKFLGLKNLKLKKLDFGSVYDEISKKLEQHFGSEGPVSKFMLKRPKHRTFWSKLRDAWCLPKPVATHSSSL
jgi:hypothetical protein